MAVLDDEVTDLEVNLIELEVDVNFLFDEQVIQDERIFNLEQTSIETNEDVEGSVMKCSLTFDEKKRWALL